jgi:hypothetical protein
MSELKEMPSGDVAGRGVVHTNAIDLQVVGPTCATVENDDPKAASDKIRKVI